MPGNLADGVEVDQLSPGLMLFQRLPAAHGPHPISSCWGALAACPLQRLCCCPLHLPRACPCPQSQSLQYMLASPGQCRRAVAQAHAGMAVLMLSKWSPTDDLWEAGADLAWGIAGAAGEYKNACNSPWQPVNESATWMQGRIQWHVLQSSCPGSLRRNTKGIRMMIRHWQVSGAEHLTHER